MRILTLAFQIALTTLFVSCGQQQSADIDPAMGLECFETHRASFPPGTQYEGIEKLEERVLTIKIMDGVKVVTLECALTPGGTLHPAGK